uniref:Sirohydrochlorin ferrochelatase n=1 Tax=Timspurckia oligopyrenoides TaxID=708627 RepID=A0A7S0ZFC5_9RHOD|mmetsp:Transcript_3075/g.5425  ORF Transcript_3075/g.5425 Transcript_3075/m.5425 type:complete len:206 (+) Transcript_3075:72-689(+)
MVAFISCGGMMHKAVLKQQRVGVNSAPVDVFVSRNSVASSSLVFEGCIESRTRRYSGNGQLQCSLTHDTVSTVKMAIVVVDHGSRRAQSNEALNDMAEVLFQRAQERCPNLSLVSVEPAHMELASPTIYDAMRKCIQDNASQVLIVPYFLSKGKHIVRDIPELVSKAENELRKEFSNVQFSTQICDPIGVSNSVADILLERAGLV